MHNHINFIFVLYLHWLKIFTQTKTERTQRKENITYLYTYNLKIKKDLIKFIQNTSAYKICVKNCPKNVLKELLNIPSIDLEIWVFEKYLQNFWIFQNSNLKTEKL